MSDPVTAAIAALRRVPHERSDLPPHVVRAVQSAERLLSLYGPVPPRLKAVQSDNVVRIEMGRR